MSNRQFRTICSLGWLNALLIVDDIAMALVAAAFCITYAVGAILAQIQEGKQERNQ